MRSLRTDIGVSVAASVAMFVSTIVGGQVLIATTAPAIATAAPAPMMSCLERPITPLGTSTIRGGTHLCLTVDDVEATVELNSAASGDLYTAWLGFHDRPGMGEAGACPSAQSAVQADLAQPSRIGAAGATSDGTVRLSQTLTSLRPAGNTVLEVLVVHHGPVAGVGSTDRTRHLLSWDRTWSALPATAVARLDESPRLLGCAAFWLRGGAELTDH